MSIPFGYPWALTGPGKDTSSTEVSRRNSKRRGWARELKEEQRSSSSSDHRRIPQKKVNLKGEAARI